MGPLPFRFEDWKEKTAAGALAVRSSHLKALDEAIRAYDRQAGIGMANESHLVTVREALLRYIADEEARGGVDSWKRGARNRDRIIETLASAVGLGATANLDDVQAFGLDESMVPQVAEPEIRPIGATPLPRIDATLEARAQQVAVSSSTPARPRLPSVAPSAAPAPVAPKIDTVPLVRIEVESLNSDLIALRMELESKLGSDRSYYQNCVTKGFKDFKDLHTQEADAINFKLSLAKSAFEALKAAPFPFSIVGSIGAGVVGVFNADKEWTSLRVELPTPGGIMGAVEAAGKKFKQFTTVNISPSGLSTQESVVNSFLVHVEEFRQDILNGYKKRIQPLADWNARASLAESLNADAGKKGGDPVADAKKFLKDVNDDIRLLFRDFLQSTQPDWEKAAAWITVQMIADYAAAQCGGQDITKMTVKELGKKSFGDPFARFLCTENVGVVKMKPNSGASDNIYAGGQIPWDGSSANHKIAIFLYLDWYRRTINPFLMLTGKLPPALVQHYSEAYVRNLGQAMRAHKKNAFESMQNLQGAIDAAGKSHFAAGGDIGDAFTYGT